MVGSQDKGGLMVSTPPPQLPSPSLEVGPWLPRPALPRVSASSLTPDPGYLLTLTLPRGLSTVGGALAQPGGEHLTCRTAHHSVNTGRPAWHYTSRSCQCDSVAPSPGSRPRTPPPRGGVSGCGRQADRTRWWGRHAVPPSGPIWPGLGRSGPCGRALALLF